MTHDLKDRAHAFYTAFKEKAWHTLEGFLHPKIHLKTPLSHLEGAHSYLEAAKGFSHFVENMHVRKIFTDHSQAVVIYDHQCAAPIGLIQSAALLTFEEGRIKEIEIFHDTSPFQGARDRLSA